MPNHLGSILPSVLLAVAAGFVGGLAPLFWKPNVRARSAIQHFAAGAVIVAVASGVIPEVERLGTVFGVVSGFAVGGLAMIGMKWLVLRFERRERERGRQPIGLAAAAAADTLVDGALISAGFFAGRQVGTLLAVALAVELFFLTLSVGSEYRERRAARWRGILVTSGISGLLVLGALGASALLEGTSEATLATGLAFGAAALIYLIAEELLVETIQAEESLLSTAMLFAGFAVVLTLKLVSRN